MHNIGNKIGGIIDKIKEIFKNMGRVGSAILFLLITFAIMAAVIYFLGIKSIPKKNLRKRG